SLIQTVIVDGPLRRGQLTPACTDCNDAKSTAEKRFLARGYDLADVTRDPDLGDWITRARELRG
ncbi:hypothetical protein, partial [Sphingomonas melonis]|uniref:hypothetical protein n=1 Tax=Sphingomonas melonis TaxID=152682 RepID=UPI0035C7D0AE